MLDTGLFSLADIFSILWYLHGQSFNLVSRSMIHSSYNYALLAI